MYDRKKEIGGKIVGLIVPSSETSGAGLDSAAAQKGRLVDI